MKKVKDPERSRRVRVRYAPSPTGIPHIGNTRTALFNFLFAKNQRGDFILRVEDTDRKRFSPESVEIIGESLKSLGLSWDEYFLQSKRLDIYQKHLFILQSKNSVYQEQGAWRFRVPKAKKVSWHDVVHGQVEFSSDVIEDFVVLKSDGFPTYHLASVVDDH
ncbi:glutamate--tRNA ligase, partial [Candidatus Curtissbacteria bacterium]|nr:glutamate--tRNA ligase [Candidatus Curtissbacteria bacterium]